MSVLSARVHTFGDAMRSRHGEHKVALDAGFTCPSRDGSKGVGGCSFCHNKSFAPGTRGRIAQGTRARRFIASGEARAMAQIAPHCRCQIREQTRQAGLADAMRDVRALGFKIACTPAAPTRAGSPSCSSRPLSITRSAPPCIRPCSRTPTSSSWRVASPRAA